jgi:hypothetical protein
MLSKCANPSCPNTFRYLHEGKLYLVHFGAALSREHCSSVSHSASRSPEYAWLCSSCSCHMTIRVEEGFTVVVVHKSETLQSRNSGHLREVS